MTIQSTYIYQNIKQSSVTAEEVQKKKKKVSSSLKYKVEEATSKVLEEFYVRWKGSTFVNRCHLLSVCCSSAIVRYHPVLK